MYSLIITDYKSMSDTVDYIKSLLIYMSGMMYITLS